MLKARDHAENALLLAPFEVGLEADEVVQRTGGVLGAQLHSRPRAVAGARIPQADRAQRTEPDGISPARGHDLNGHAALVDRQVAVEIMQRRALGRNESGMEDLVLFLIKGTVEVVGLAAAIAGSGEYFLVVQAFGGDDGRYCVKKAQPVVAGEVCNCFGQGTFGQGAAGDQHRGAFVKGGHFLTVYRDIRVLFHHLRDGGGKDIAVHGQRTACRHAGGLGSLQKMAAHLLHFELEQAGCRIRALGFQRIGADQLGKAGAFMGGRKLARFLFVQVHLHTGVCQPQRGSAPRQTGTDHVYLHSHFL